LQIKKEKTVEKTTENSGSVLRRRETRRVERAARCNKHGATMRQAHHNYDPRIICSLGMLIPRLGNKIAGLGSRKELP